MKISNPTMGSQYLVIARNPAKEYIPAPSSESYVSSFALLPDTYSD